MADLKPGKYKHYKGKYYEVIGVCKHSETLEELVVYKALYQIDGLCENSLWVRPLELFLDNIMVDGNEMPRFAYTGN
ncbi:MAG: DUF1653 domain-containing protein [Sphingobacteriales bacterium]|nr:MAG: DUF1653 domain-containing protein [Sphingobacteriales bacterium]